MVEYCIYAFLGWDNSCRLFRSLTEAAKKQHDCCFDELITAKEFVLEDRCFNAWIYQFINAL